MLTVSHLSKQYPGNPALSFDDVSFAMACFILILPIVNLFNSDFMRGNGKAGSVSFLDFFAGEFAV